MEKIIELHNKTGMSMMACKKAIEYAKIHTACTPIGYLKAISFAVATPKMKFEDRVRMFSKEE